MRETEKGGKKRNKYRMSQKLCIKVDQLVLFSEILISAPVIGIFHWQRDGAVLQIQGKLEGQPAPSFSATK